MADRNVILAFCVLSCMLLSASAAKSAPTFSDYLADLKSATTADSKPSYYYEESETVCLKDTLWDNCAALGCYPCSFTQFAVQTHFTCCDHEERYEDGLLFTRPHSIGHCEWKFDFYSTGPLDVGETPETVEKIGEASAVCRMDRDAEKCGGAACDKMVIGVQAGVYLSTVYSHYGTNSTINIGTETSGFSNPYPTCCILSEGAYGSLFGIPQCKAPAPAPTVPKKDKLKFDQIKFNHPLIKKWTSAKMAAKPAYAAEEGTVWQGLAMIIAGPMFISTPHGAPQKIEETGYFEYVPVTSPMTPLVGAPLDKIYWVKPGSYKLRFSSEEESRKY